MGDASRETIKFYHAQCVATANECHSGVKLRTVANGGYHFRKDFLASIPPPQWSVPAQSPGLAGVPLYIRQGARGWEALYALAFNCYSMPWPILTQPLFLASP